MNISDADFWRMPPRRFWWRVEAFNKANGPAKKKGLTASEAKRLRKMVEVHNATRTQG